MSHYSRTLLRMSSKEREVVSTNTVGQSSVLEWYEQRKGRLTASKFLQICNKTEHLQNSSSVDADSLISSILDYKPAPNTAALKHGRSMELHVKASFVSLAHKAHYKFKSSEAGLVVMKDKAFIAVSPDLEIECLCCGKGLVEIKCPYSIRDTVPTVDNLKYLHTVNGKVQLKQNPEYFYQIQGQMGATGRKYCNLSIFTSHGHLIEKYRLQPCILGGHVT